MESPEQQPDRRPDQPSRRPDDQQAMKPGTPRPHHPQPDQPRPGQPAHPRPTPSAGAVLGTIVFVLAVIATVFAMGLGGIGVLLMLVFAASWPLAAPGILLYVVAVCLPVGLAIWLRHRSGIASGPFRTLGPIPIAAGAAAAIGIGQVFQLGRVPFLVLIFFWLAAALPPLAALALAAQRLGAVTTWRRALFGLVCGSLVSTTATLLLGGLVTAAAYAIVLPLREIVAHVMATPDAERLFFSPALAVAMVGAAIVAPLVEELAKPLAVLVLGRRLRSPAEAFLVGMAAGTGFAIVENMLYESGGQGLWAAVATLRGIGGVLHPLNAGLVAMGWYGALCTDEPARWRRLAGFYGLAVCVHALWNGGLTLIFSAAGAYVFAADTWRVDVYGLGQPGIVLVFMALEAIALWRLLLLVTDQRRGAAATADGGLGLRLDDPRRLAAWATGVLLVLVPIGLLYGPLLTRYADRLVPLH
jgi:RsiW-degrading membrane proteinase PrsW (M82 family)